MACRCCQLWFCCDRVRASPCHGEGRCAWEHHAHQVAAARKAPLHSAWKAAPGAGCPAWGKCGCGTHTAEMLHSHGSLQLLLAEPYQPQLCAKSSWPHPYNQSVLLGAALPRGVLWAFRAERTITRTKIRAFKGAALQLPRRALQSKREQKQREKPSSFSL